VTDTFTRPRIDPRFARRRVEVRRANGRRRLRLLIVTVSVVLAAGLAAGSFLTPLWKVRHVRIQVRGPISRQRIEALAGLDRQRLMIDVNPARIAARLDAVPNLGGARVSRQWPGTVSIEVGVRAAVAQVSRGATTWATVDPTGRILADASSQIPGMPVIRVAAQVPEPGGWLASALGPTVAPGTPAAQEVDLNAPSGSTQAPDPVEAALVAMQVMPPSVKAEIISVTIGATGSLALSLLPANFAAGSISVNLGDGSQLGQKVSALVALVTESDLSKVTQIDLTVPDRPVLLTAR
jgi:cell division septal protein FtsQ